MSDENLSPLERLRRRLYAPQAPKADIDPALSQQSSSVGTGWTPEPSVPTPPPQGPRQLSLSAKFLIGAVVFSVLAGVGATAIVLLGTRSVSTDQIVIDVEGPVTAASGDSVSFLVRVKNGSPTELHSMKLSVDLPETSRSPENPQEPIERYTDTLGTLGAGKSAERTVRAIVHGAEHETLVVPVTVEYQTEGSNAVFIKKQEYSFTITTSPLTMKVETLSETPSGQPLAVTVTVRSNATEPLENVVVAGTYPFGFTLSSADPAPAFGTFWRIGTIEPGREKTIVVRGTLTGQQNDERIFRFTAGTAGLGATAINVPYTSREASLTITKPFLAVGLSLNHEDAETVVVAPGSGVQGLLAWENTLSTALTDAQVIVRVTGNALDPVSVSSSGGFYRSSDGSIIFNRETSSSLRRLEPGDTGTGSFSLRTKTAAQLAGVKNPTITFSVSVAGRRAGESQVPESASNILTRTIQIATETSLTSRAVRTTGPFTNTGPWPPEADRETTYTVYLSANNSLNGVADGAVTFTLPTYVRYTGAVSPSDGSVVYDDASRTVTWRVGDVPAGGSGKQIALQVALTPSVTQKGQTPVLIGPQTFTGVDRFTGGTVTATARELDIRVTSDPAYQSSYGMVKN